MKIMKLFRSCFVFVLFISLMCACTTDEASIDSAEEAEAITRKTYEEWKDMEYKVWHDGLLPEVQWVNENERNIKYPNYPFILVEDDQIKSLNDLKKQVENICTSEFAENHYYSRYLNSENPLYCEIEGELYIGIWENTTYYPVISEVVLIKRDKKNIQAKITGLNKNASSEEYEELSYIIDIILEKGKWYVSNLEEFQ